MGYRKCTIVRTCSIMKKAVFFFLFLFVILLAGCGNKAVSKSQVKKDLSNDDVVQNCFSSDFTKDSSFQIDNFSISKEQFNEESKQDLIYCDLIIKNNYFRISLSTKCIYNYYDNGGWILDECMIENMNEVTPIAPPDAELAYKYISEQIEGIGSSAVLSTYGGKEYELRFGDISLKDSSLLDGKTAAINVEYISDVLQINGQYLFEFYESGWRYELDDEDYKSDNHYTETIMQIVDYKADYGKALGSFTLKSSLNIPGVDMSHTGSLNVIEISEASVKYNLQYWMAHENRYGKIVIDTGDNLTATFSPISGEFVIGYMGAERSGVNRHDDVCYKLTYNPEKDEWSQGAYDDFCRN